MGPSCLCPHILASYLPNPTMGSPGSVSACPEEGGLSQAFSPSPSWLPFPAPPQAQGAPIFPWKYGNVHFPLADPHPTSNKAQTVSTPAPAWGGTGWVHGPLPVPGQPLSPWQPRAWQLGPLGSWGFSQCERQREGRDRGQPPRSQTRGSSRPALGAGLGS